MPEIKLEWLDEPRNILRVNYPQGWDWDDYHDVLDRVAEVQGDRTDPVTFVNVYERGALLPRTAPGSHWQRTVRTFTIDFVVYVTQDVVLKTILRRFLHTINFTEGEKYTFAESVEEALDLLTKRGSGTP